MKHNSASAKNIAFAYEENEDMAQLGKIEDIPITTQTDNIRPVANVSEKEKLLNRIK